MPKNQPTTVLYLGDDLGGVSIIQNGRGTLAQFSLPRVNNSTSLLIEQLEDTSFIGVPVVSQTSHELTITRK